MNYNRTGWNVNHPNNKTGIHPGGEPLRKTGVVILKETRHHCDGAVIKWTWHGMDYSTPDGVVNGFRIVDLDGRVFPLEACRRRLSMCIMNLFESKSGVDSGLGHYFPVP